MLFLLRTTTFQIGDKVKINNNNNTKEPQNVDMSKIMCTLINCRSLSSRFKYLCYFV